MKPSSAHTPCIIIGIDPGTRAAGYGILKIEGSRCLPLEYGVIRPKADALLTDRYAELFQEVALLLDSFSPLAVAVESQYIQEFAGSALKLGRAQAMVLLAATLRKIPVFEYTPTEIKKALAARGNATKEQMRQMSQKLLQLSKAPSHDAADALAIALCHSHRMKSITPPSRI